MGHFVHQIDNLVEIRERPVGLQASERRQVQRGLQNGEIEGGDAAVRAQACDQFSLSPRRRDQGPWNPVFTQNDIHFA